MQPKQFHSNAVVHLPPQVQQEQSLQTMDSEPETKVKSEQKIPTTTNLDDQHKQLEEANQNVIQILDGVKFYLPVQKQVSVAPLSSKQ